ncbi:MAG: hypothetical protein GC180_01625 [Bacteroidetes bacterium]|nr:hypothetical protein [Bacteroidota bacterium]
MLIVQVIRVNYVPVFSDEVSSYFRYISRAQWDPYYKLNSNNHVLNTWLEIVATFLFGTSNFTLRLANLVAFGGFLCLSFFHFRQKNVVVWITSILLLSANYYFFSLFGLARGYGISFFWFLFTYVSLDRYHRNAQIKWVYAAFLGIGLMCWANMGLIPFSLAFIGIGLLEASKNNALRNYRIYLSLLPYLIAIHFAFLLKINGHLYHGDSFGYYQTLIKKLPEEFGLFDHSIRIWTLSLLALTILAGLLFWKKTSHLFKVTLILLLWGFVSPALLHWTFGVNYPLDRAAAHLYIPVILYVLLVSKEIIWFRYWVPGLLLVFNLNDFYSDFNLEDSPHWQSEHVPSYFIDTLARQSKGNPRIPSIEMHGLQGRSWDFQVFLKKEKIFQTDCFYSRSCSDYLLISQWQMEIDTTGYQRILTNKSKNLFLFKRTDTPTFVQTIKVPISKINRLLEKGYFVLDSNLLQNDLQLIVKAYPDVVPVPANSRLGLIIQDGEGEKECVVNLDRQQRNPDYYLLNQSFPAGSIGQDSIQVFMNGPVNYGPHQIQVDIYRYSVNKKFR